MDKYKYVLRALLLRKSEWVAIAYHSSISHRTIYNIVNMSGSPNTSTIDKLYDFLKSQERKKII
jgi:ABC-type molybdate transport system substrate-binding protein